MIDSANPESEGPTLPPLRPVVPRPAGTFHPVVRALLFVLFCFLLFIFLPGAVSRLAGRLPGVAQLALAYVLLDAALLAESWLFVQAFDRRSFRTVGLWFYQGWGRELAAGAGVGAGLLAAVVAGLVVARGVAYHGLAELDGKRLLQLLTMAVILLLAAAFEEMAFRGYGFQRMVDAVGPVVATAVFAGLFGAVHIRNPSVTALALVNTALSGVLLSVAYLKTRGLWLPIGLHWAWNFFMGPVFSLPVSGIRVGPMLLRGELTGAKWLTGGAYGPEGGVVLTAACALVIVGLARTRRVSPSPAMEEALK